MNTNLESIIPLLNKNLKIIQRSDYFNFSIDSLLISEFVNIQKNTKKILDLGTGNAAIPLFLSKKTSARIYGIEIQEISYNLALKNININNLNDQIYIIYDNMKNYLKYFNKGFFDIIISNPPYMDDNGKKINENEHKAISRHEIKLSLSELISNAKRLLKPIGLLFFIHRTHRLVEIIKALDKNNFSVKKIIFIYSARNNKSTMVFVEAIKGKKVKLEIQNYYIYH